jgi:hypothetical protein
VHYLICLQRVTGVSIPQVGFELAAPLPRSRFSYKALYIMHLVRALGASLRHIVCFDAQVGRNGSLHMPNPLQSLMTIGVLVCLVPSAPSAAAVDTHEVAASLRSTWNADELKNPAFRIDWSKARPYEKLAYAEGLLPSLSRLEEVEIRHYEWVKGTHDLRIVAGRAAYHLQEVLGLRLPAVTPEMTQQQAADLYHQALPVVKAYRTAVEDMSRQYGASKSVAELKAAFAGRIKPGVSPQKWRDHLSAFEDLLGQWCPIGRKLADLVEIVGSPGEKEGNHHIYSFDSGFFGVHYRFVVVDGVITSVLSRT